MYSNNENIWNNELSRHVLIMYRWILQNQILCKIIQYNLSSDSGTCQGRPPGIKGWMKGMGSRNRRLCIRNCKLKAKMILKTVFSGNREIWTRQVQLFNVCVYIIHIQCNIKFCLRGWLIIEDEWFIADCGRLF